MAFMSSEAKLITNRPCTTANFITNKLHICKCAFTFL